MEARRSRCAPCAPRKHHSLKGEDAYHRRGQQHPSPSKGAALGTAIPRKLPGGALLPKLFLLQLATESLGDTVDAHLRARCVLVATRRTGDPDSADDLLAGHDRQGSFCRGDLVEVQCASPGGRGRDALTEFTRW